MIDTLFNLLFRCQHRRLTRPMTPVSRSGVPGGDTYVVCLDCGKQFGYDWKSMHIGQSADLATTSQELTGKTPKPEKSKVRYLMWASAVPLAWFIGGKVKGAKHSGKGVATEPASSGSDPATPGSPEKESAD